MNTENRYLAALVFKYSLYARKMKEKFIPEKSNAKTKIRILNEYMNTDKRKRERDIGFLVFGPVLFCVLVFTILTLVVIISNIKIETINVEAWKESSPGWKWEVDEE